MAVTHSSQKHAAQRMVTTIHTVVTAKTRHLDPVYQGRGGVPSLSYWVKGQNVHVVNGHQLFPVWSNGQKPFCSAVKRSKVTVKIP